ncbi:hypothetical protein IV203_004160 [Nitzschia inconspicua]|uniref:Uncharacterized protein n=1 Tax=Nitzschia inconspicua TaxID=303405 RepID=A0A9K3L3W3_9STRA|nr:hypothetical protein IV203_004160 [Nitzschia inconspicua]
MGGSTNSMFRFMQNLLSTVREEKEDVEQHPVSVSYLPWINVLIFDDNAKTHGNILTATNPHTCFDIDAGESSNQCCWSSSSLTSTVTTDTFGESTTSFNSDSSPYFSTRGSLSSSLGSKERNKFKRLSAQDLSSLSHDDYVSPHLDVATSCPRNNSMVK